MSFKEEIDFSKYGLNWKIPANAKTMPDNFKTNVSSVKRTNKTLVFTKPTGEVVDITLKETLGRGSYGETWSSDTRFDKDIEIVVKVIAYSEGDDISSLEYDTIQEALIQIIIYESSKDFKDLSLNLIGPFCPKFYLLGRSGPTMYIVMERVTTSLDSILMSKSKNARQRASWKPPTAGFVRLTILQLTRILKHLYLKIGYNHRDLKPDNIMFNMVNGKPNLKLIDFGFSCLKYRDLYLKSISNDVYSTRLKHCDSETRDLHAFFYYFSYHTYYREVNCPLKRLIKALMASDDAAPKNWVATYLNYNAKNANSNPARPYNLNLDTVHNIFRDIEFSKTNDSCTSFNYKWANHLVKLYKNTLPYLTNDEYVKGITDSVKNEFLKVYLTKPLSLNFWTNSASPTQLIDDVSYSVELSDGIHKDKTVVALDYLRDFIIDNSDYLPKDLVGETLLHKAVRAGKEELVKKILSRSDNRLLNLPNSASLTALDIAIDNDNISLQDILIEKNAVTSKYSAQYIASNDHIFSSILNKNRKIFNRLGDGNIFNAVIKYDKGEMCKILAQLDMPIDIKSFYYDLANLNDTEVIVLLWNKYRNDRYINEVSYWSSPLVNAVYKTNIELVKLFLSYPKIITTNKDIYGRTCLHYAVMAFIAATGETSTKAFEIIKLLIEANPALPDIKDNDKRGPGNPHYARDSEARSYIKSKKSTFFTKRKNTNLNKKGGLRKTRRYLNR